MNDLCGYCGESWQLHYIKPGKVVLQSGFMSPGLVFYCDTKLRTPTRLYDPTLPYDLWTMLGHRLTPAQRGTLISLRYSHG